MARLPPSRHPLHCGLRIPDLRATDHSPLNGSCHEGVPAMCPTRTFIGRIDKAEILVKSRAATPKPASRAEGVFAIGDVRSGSVKRVAAAVGEGAQVVAML